ncbi:hypothetical protein RRG08_001892 [Elysia crispata]|uniref:Uncharacterized protein n=1 Tax=Elysia crispata TaxID=231223 RepID=A0AAE1DU73_9GAST|nr:hypothetical protein RRG08_001892 [Elysia crispata]
MDRVKTKSEVDRVLRQRVRWTGQSVKTKMTSRHGRRANFLLMRGSRTITDVPHRKAELSQNVRISVGLAREELDFEASNSRNFLAARLQDWIKTARKPELISMNPDRAQTRAYFHEPIPCANPQLISMNPDRAQTRAYFHEPRPRANQSLFP